MAVTHAFVPPTPGPVAVAYFLEVNLGYVIAFGILVGLPTAIICGPFLCSKMATLVDVKTPPAIEENDHKEDKKLPSFLQIASLIGLPIALILAGTIVEQTAISGIDSGLSKAERGQQVSEILNGMPIGSQVIHFLGHPVIALMISTLLAIYFLGILRGTKKEDLVEISTKALGPAGIIILITGAGGVFKGVLIATGIADALKAVFEGSPIPIIVLAYIFATLVRIAQGSATVAMLTAAGLMVSFVEGFSQPYLALIACAIAAGATGFSHVNDSGFWMISRYLGMTEKQTLKTWTIISTAISLVSFSIILIISLFIPMK